MNTKELESFLSIAETGSITKAAANLYISPQGLSSLLKKLEKEYGVALFERNPSGVVLNEYGKIFLEKAKQMVKLNKELHHELDNLKRRNEGMIRMVSAYGVLRRLSPEFLFEFSKQNPNIHLDYMEFPDKYIEEMLMEEKADIGYAIAPIDTEQIYAEFLYEEEIVLLIRKDDKLASKKYITFDDIKNREFIIESELFKIHRIFYDKCKAHGFLPQVIFSTSGYSLCHKLCSEGKGISLTLKRNFKEMESDNLITIPFEEDFKWQVYMITNKRRRQETYLKKLIEFSKYWIDSVKI